MSIGQHFTNTSDSGNNQSKFYSLRKTSDAIKVENALKYLNFFYKNTRKLNEATHLKGGYKCINYFSLKLQNSRFVKQ